MMNLKNKPACWLTGMAIFVACHTAVRAGETGRHRYTDDAIVRDLKAGKLTVREAQILRDRHPPPVVKTATHKPATRPGAKPSVPVRHVMLGKKRVTPMRPAAVPVRRKMTRHQAASPATHHPVIARTEPVRTAKAPASSAPVRKTAVRYIR